MFAFDVVNKELTDYDSAETARWIVSELKDGMTTDRLTIMVSMIHRAGILSGLAIAGESVKEVFGKKDDDNGAA